MGPEDINPYTGDDRDKTAQVRSMFDNIAPAYDFMNRAMTMGIDRWWRRLAVKRVKRHGAGYILDVATGTGDLAIQLARAVDPISITGVDLSENMLERGRRKVSEADLGDVIKFYAADCLQLPLPDESYDVVTVAYGVRNFENLEAGYAEMFRVTRRGGMLCVLELSVPTNRLVRKLYDIYALHVIPFIGKLISHDSRAYAYLPESIAAVPQGERMLDIMRRVGFADCRYKSLTLGVCTIYTAIRADSGDGEKPSCDENC